MRGQLLCILILCSANLGCGDLIETYETFTVTWGSDPDSPTSCVGNGQSYDELFPVDFRWDAVIHELEVTSWEATAQISGGGSFAFSDFGIAEPDEASPFLEASDAACQNGTLVLSDTSAANLCLDQMRDLANDKTTDEYAELVEALNDRDGLQIRTVISCSGQISIDWEIEMQIYNWQRRDW